LSHSQGRRREPAQRRAVPATPHWC